MHCQKWLLELPLSGAVLPGIDLVLRLALRQASVAAVLLSWSPLLCSAVPEMGVDPVGKITRDICKKPPEQLFCVNEAHAMHSA